MLDTKEAWIKQDAYLAFLEESLTASLKEEQPSEADLLDLYITCCKKRGIEPDLLFSQTLSLEQRDRREAKK
jgi:predicted HicB family RNase H-like nuclease